MGHEAQGGEHADACQHLEGGVSERGNQAGAGEVGAWLQVGSVGQHDAEAHGQREEDLAVSGDPHAGVLQRAPVRSEEGVQALGSAFQEECADHEDGEENHQHGHEDHGQLADATVHVQCQHQDGEDPHGDHDQQDWHHVFTREGGGGVSLEEVIEQVGFWVSAPGLGEGLHGVDGCPRHDGGVVDGDEEAHAHLEPADDLAVSGEAAESQGSGGAPAVADGEVEPQDGNTRGQQCDQVRNQEGAAAVFIGDIRETPNIAQAHSGANGRHEEDQAGVKRLPLARRCSGFSHTRVLSFFAICERGHINDVGIDNVR